LPSAQEFVVDRYRSHLSLDYIAPPTLVAGTNTFGAYAGGGSSLYFGSMLGDQQAAAMFQVNGSLKDIAAGVTYINRRRRFDWGVSASWIPYLTGGFSRVFDASGNFTDSEIRYRQTYRTLEGMISYPFSRVSRFELSAGVNNIGFSGEQRYITYDQNGFPTATGTNTLAAPPSLTLGTA